MSEKIYLFEVQFLHLGIPSIDLDNSLTIAETRLPGRGWQPWFLKSKTPIIENTPTSLTGKRFLCVVPAL